MILNKNKIALYGVTENLLIAMLRTLSSMSPTERTNVVIQLSLRSPTGLWEQKLLRTIFLLMWGLRRHIVVWSTKQVDIDGG